jgi:hypothetical protein
LIFPCWWSCSYRDTASRKKISRAVSEDIAVERAIWAGYSWDFRMHKCISF